MIVAPITKYRTLAIAKANTPIDTGNLRHNAVKLKNIKSNSWTINYSTQDAHYIEFVEEGVGQRAQKFIARTTLILANYLNDLFNEKPTNRWYGGKLREVLSTSKDTPERQLRHFESLHKTGNIKWR